MLSRSRKLEPLLRIRIGGRGEVVGTAAVEGMRCAKAEGGKALLVLRRDGCVRSSRRRGTQLTNVSQDVVAAFLGRWEGFR